MVKKVGKLPDRTFGSKGIDWSSTCERVEKGAGAWFNVGEFSPSVASHIRAGKYPSVDPEKFEVTTQKTDQPGRSALFMRLRVPE